MDEALDETNPRDNNPRKILDIHEESPLEVEKDGDINEHGNYFISTSSSPYRRLRGLIRSAALINTYTAL